MSNGPKVTFTVSFTDAVALSNVVREAHATERYYAKRTAEENADVVEVLDDDGEVLTKAEDRSWSRKATQKAIAKRAQLSELHERVTGEPLSDD
jgi:membrane protein implicated in regulation of membrane protease activity